MYSSLFHSVMATGNTNPSIALLWRTNLDAGCLRVRLSITRMALEVITRLPTSSCGMGVTNRALEYPTGLGGLRTLSQSMATTLLPLSDRSSTCHFFSTTHRHERSGVAPTSYGAPRFPSLLQSFFLVDPKS